MRVHRRFSFNHDDPFPRALVGALLDNWIRPDAGVSSFHVDVAADDSPVVGWTADSDLSLQLEKMALRTGGRYAPGD